MLLLASVFLIIGIMVQQANFAIERINQNSNRNSHKLTEVFKGLQLAIKEQRVQSRTQDCISNFHAKYRHYPNTKEVERCREFAKQKTVKEPFFNKPLPW